jgi:hypothetical protein
VNELSTTEDDWRVIQQNLAAIAEMEWLRANSLKVLDESCLLLRRIDQINSALIDTSGARQHVFGPTSGKQDQWTVNVE